jgi:hypothetical protein
MILVNALGVALPPGSRVSGWFFMLGIALDGLVQKTGLPDSAPVWQWNGLSVLLNTLFFSLLGTLIGLAITRLRRRPNKPNQNQPRL